MSHISFPSTPFDDHRPIVIHGRLHRTRSDSCVETNYRLSAIDKIYRAQCQSLKDNFPIQSSEFEKELVKFYKSEQKSFWIISRIHGESLLKFLWAEQKKGGPIPLMLDKSRDYPLNHTIGAFKQCSLTAAEIKSLKDVSFLFIVNNHNTLTHVSFNFTSYNSKLIRITDLATLQGYIDAGIQFTTKEVVEETVDVYKV
ncbi:MAG TPA: hypothetical protein VLG76_04795 [Rhabdochlamydiaceae bacterium]|nr:hypothetical protein [Rhabdochlamydiaceae bacterium]